MPKAALYVRVSTVMQLDKESRGVQKNDLIRYCEDILGLCIMNYLRMPDFLPALPTVRIIRKCCGEYELDNLHI